MYDIMYTYFTMQNLNHSNGPGHNKLEKSNRGSFRDGSGNLMSHNIEETIQNLRVFVDKIKILYN